MASIFCPSCGSKSEYKFAIPNFCHKCGLPYSKLTNFSNSNKNFKPTTSEEVEDDEDYEEDDSFEDFSNSTRVPRIKRLEVEIDSNTDVKILKFEDIINNSSSSFKKPKNLDIGNI